MLKRGASFPLLFSERISLKTSLTPFLPDAMELILGIIVVTVAFVGLWGRNQSPRPVPVRVKTTTRRGRRL